MNTAVPAIRERDVSGDGHIVRDVPVTAGMTLLEVERRLVETARIRTAIWELSTAAGHIGLDTCWLDLESVDDRLCDALDALRWIRTHLLTAAEKPLE